MERYRSGHNGADSKSVCAKAHEGSNPSLSANAKGAKWHPFCVGGGGRSHEIDTQIRLRICGKVLNPSLSAKKIEGSIAALYLFVEMLYDSKPLLIALQLVFICDGVN